MQRLCVAQTARPSLLTPVLAHLRAGTSVVRVVVARVTGSGPREVGAWMLVTRDRAGRPSTQGSIGGGHLEWQATARAAQMLGAGSSAGAPRLLKRFALGATLGQCCGGAVSVLFDRYDVTDLAQLEGQFEPHCGPHCAPQADLAAHLLTPFDAAHARRLGAATDFSSSCKTRS